MEIVERFLNENVPRCASTWTLTAVLIGQRALCGATIPWYASAIAATGKR